MPVTEQQQPQVQEVLKGVAWVVEPVLTTSECQELVEDATQAGIKSSIAAGDRRHRNCCAHYFRDEDLSLRIWERLQEHVPTRIEFQRQHIQEPPVGFRNDDIEDMLGRWAAVGTNPQFTLLYYKPGGHFGPHRDGYKILSEHRRSLLTVTIYLTARSSGSGGATHFLVDELDLQGPDETGRIQAPVGTVRVSVEGDSTGKGIVFWHDVMHQGEVLREDSIEPKWLLLTQVLFERDPSSAPQMTDEQRVGRECLKQAEQEEALGNITGAIRMYNRAYRLDPRLENLND